MDAAFDAQVSQPAPGDAQPGAEDTPHSEPTLFIALDDQPEETNA